MPTVFPSFCAQAPMRAGVGLKAEHYATVLDTLPSIGFFEVHAENYMCAGGPPHRYLTKVRESYPLSLHGVGLSIGSEQRLNRLHLRRLKALSERYAPTLLSEHLAWSSHDSHFLNDLLPIPYTKRTLDRVVDHIDEIHEALGRQILLENPSTYIAFQESEYTEENFIAEVARRAGCGLLLDINNVHVATSNHSRNAFSYIDNFPLGQVKQIHLAGHAREVDESGRPLLIDTHDREVDPHVWDLYRFAIGRIGPVPTLIEWDASVPAWETLKAQAARADAVMFDGTLRHYPKARAAS